MTVSKPPVGSAGPMNLVGNIDTFPMQGCGTEETSLIFPPNKLGLNPTLNKQLKVSISAVSPKVVAVRKSFDAVGGIVEQFSANKRDAQLLQEWKSIEEDYTAFLEESGDLAIRGAEMINDFLESVLPYLFSNSDLDEKCKELKAYCETLQEGEKQARKFSKTLDSVAVHVLEFKDQWQQRVEDAVEGLKESIKRLENEISDLAKSIRGVNGSVSELKLDKVEKERGKKLQQQEVHQRSKAEKLVSKHSDNISANADGLRVVWNLIYDDLYLIETHLRVTASGKGQALFQQRLAKLPEQYNTLKDALQKYSLALSMKPGSTEKSFFNKLRSVFH